MNSYNIIFVIVFMSLYRLLVTFIILFMVYLSIVLVWSNTLYTYSGNQYAKTDPVISILAKTVNLEHYRISSYGINSIYGTYTTYVNDLDHNTHITVYAGDGTAFNLIRDLKNRLGIVK